MYLLETLLYNIRDSFYILFGYQLTLFSYLLRWSKIFDRHFLLKCHLNVDHHLNIDTVIYYLDLNLVYILDNFRFIASCQPPIKQEHKATVMSSNRELRDVSVC